MLNTYKTIIGVGLVMLLCGIGIFAYYTINEKKNGRRPELRPTQQQSEQKIADVKDQELKEQIGQMLMIGFRGTEISKDSYIVQEMEDLNIGGVILFDYDVPSKSFPRNIISPKQTKNLIADLKKFSGTPLFVAIDAEGGKVNRLKEKYGFIAMPSPQKLGAQNNPEETKKISAALARQLADLGFNVNFAPVVDVNINPDNPIIGGIGRTFSNEPNKVVEQALAFIEGHSEPGIITCLKHFPGHGSSRNDSHLGMVDITNTYQDKELIPFEKIIEQEKACMVMTAHIINKNIDSEYPATLSPLFIQNILREKLGFNGVIVSDDMQMGAITEHYGFDEAIIRAINAGCDLLIISNNGKIYDEQAPEQARDIIFNAVKQGKISREQITQSYLRIITLKSKL
ncbi:beta-N-acetylhexosaminidase [Candidatus Parcubacteria bacterium]|nr:beta-N-acetylhexosaminidase [Candidatus Parcubacteria bacterium]